MLNTPRKLRAVRGELDATYSHVFATLRPGRLRITTGNPLGIPDEAFDPGNPNSEVEIQIPVRR